MQTVGEGPRNGYDPGGREPKTTNGDATAAATQRPLARLPRAAPPNCRHVSRNVRQRRVGGAERPGHNTAGGRVGLGMT